PVSPWLDAETTRARAEPVLPPSLVPFLHATVDAYKQLTPLEDELVFGHFDGHGWNMAFDHAAGRLNGLFDFGDSGLGARHQDLSYGNWIAPDLTLRMLDRYARRTGRRVLPARVMLYSAMLRCVELAETAPDGAGLAARLAAVEQWAG